MIVTTLLLPRSRFNYVIQDPTVNLLISSVIINYILPGVAMILCSVLLIGPHVSRDRNTHL